MTLFGIIETQKQKYISYYVSTFYGLIELFFTHPHTHTSCVTWHYSECVAVPSTYLPTTIEIELSYNLHRGLKMDISTSYTRLLRNMTLFGVRGCTQYLPTIIQTQKQKYISYYVSTFYGLIELFFTHPHTHTSCVTWHYSECVAVPSTYLPTTIEIELSYNLHRGLKMDISTSYTRLLRNMTLFGVRGCTQYLPTTI